jgi:hypothetical protein
MKKIYTYEIKFQVVKAKGSYTYWANRSERYEVEEEDPDYVLAHWNETIKEAKKLVSINQVRVHVPA